MDTGMAIREFRLWKKKTQIELAEELNISRETLNGIEKGRHNPSQKVLKSLQETFGLTPNKLMLLSLSKDDVESLKWEDVREAQIALLRSF